MSLERSSQKALFCLPPPKTDLQQLKRYSDGRGSWNSFFCGWWIAHVLHVWLYMIINIYITSFFTYVYFSTLYSIFIYIYICIHMDIYAHIFLRVLRKVIDGQESNSLHDKGFSQVAPVTGRRCIPANEELTANPSMKAGLGPDPWIPELPWPFESKLIFLPLIHFHVWFQSGVRTSLQKWLVIQNRPDEDGEESTFYAPKWIWSMDFVTFCLKIFLGVLDGSPLGFSFFHLPKLPNHKKRRQFLKKTWNQQIWGTNFFIEKWYVRKLPKGEIFPVVFGGSISTISNGKSGRGNQTLEQSLVGLCLLGRSDGGFRRSVSVSKRGAVGENFPEDSHGWHSKNRGFPPKKWMVKMMEKPIF